MDYIIKVKLGVLELSFSPVKKFMLFVFSTSSPLRFYSKLFHRKVLGKYFVLLNITERSNNAIRIKISQLFAN